VGIASSNNEIPRTSCGGFAGGAARDAASAERQPATVKAAPGKSSALDFNTSRRELKRCIHASLACVEIFAANRCVAWVQSTFV